MQQSRGGGLYVHQWVSVLLQLPPLVPVTLSDARARGGHAAAYRHCPQHLPGARVSTGTVSRAARSSLARSPPAPSGQPSPMATNSGTLEVTARHGESGPYTPVYCMQGVTVLAPGGLKKKVGLGFFSVYSTPPTRAPHVLHPAKPHARIRNT